MQPTTVTNAVKLLEELLDVLDNAYWEASKIAHKDAIYDIISLLNAELNELAKLSVEDHYITYEPISPAFRHCGGRLRTLHNNTPTWVLRQRTAAQLNALLPNVATLVGA